ncbi:MAG: hypothetical protein R3B06_17695 [Kofleriaceae bacterium]
MSFPWLVPSRADGAADRRTAVALAELRDRAALLARLGFTPAATTARLAASVAWDFDPSGGPHRRPAALADAALAALVDEIYRRQQR